MNDQKTVTFISLFGVCFVIGFIILVAGFDYVPAGNIGVTDRFGQVGEVPWGPGIRWTGIWTSTKEFSVRIQLREFEANAASKDLQIVKTKIALNFRIRPEKTPEIYRTLGMNYQEVLIPPVIQEAVKSSTASYSAAELITQRMEVKQDITNYIVEKLEGKGIVVTEVSMTDFDFSEEFNKAIEAKQVAEQKASEAENKFKEMEWTSKSMQLQKEVLEIKKLDLQQKWIEKWDGRLPMIVSGDGQGMFMQINPNEWTNKTQ